MKKTAFVLVLLVLVLLPAAAAPRLSTSVGASVSLSLGTDGVSIRSAGFKLEYPVRLGSSAYSGYCYLFLNLGVSIPFDSLDCPIGASLDVLYGVLVEGVCSKVGVTTSLSPVDGELKFDAGVMVATEAYLYRMDYDFPIPYSVEVGARYMLLNNSGGSPLSIEGSGSIGVI